MGACFSGSLRRPLSLAGNELIPGSWGAVWLGKGPSWQSKWQLQRSQRGRKERGLLQGQTGSSTARHVAQEGRIWDRRGKVQEGLLGHNKKRVQFCNGKLLYLRDGNKWSDLHFQQSLSPQLGERYEEKLWKTKANKGGITAQAGHDGGGAGKTLVKMESNEWIRGLFWVWNDSPCWHLWWSSFLPPNNTLPGDNFPIKPFLCTAQPKYKSSISSYLKQNVPKWENIPG